MENPESRESGEHQEVVPSESALTVAQLEGQKQMERLGEAKEAAEISKQHLAGLKYSPISSEESKKFFAAGVFISAKSKITRNILPELYAAKTDISQQRINEIAAREKSIIWLLKSGGGVERAELQDARFFTIEELAQRRKECAELYKQAAKEIKNPNAPHPAFQRLVDEYCFAGENLFNLDNNEIILNHLEGEELDAAQKKLIAASEWQGQYGNRLRKMIEDSRTGIDPGLLAVAKNRRDLSTVIRGYGGVYNPGRGFNGLLRKTGLIALPVNFPVESVVHEYKHFEDAMFETKDRKRVGDIVSEINSFILQNQQRDFREYTDTFFEELKGIIQQFYVKYYRGRMPIKEVREKALHATDSIRRLHKNGFSSDAISSILISSNKLEDIFQWDEVNDQELQKLAKARKEEIKNSLAA